MDQESRTHPHQFGEPETGEAASGDELEATRGINLSGLLGGLLGGPGAAEDSGGLGGLLSALLGGGGTTNLAALAPETGLSASSLQAVVPLIAAALSGQGHGAEKADAEATRNALVDLAEGKAGAVDALAGGGLLQQIMHLTGLNQKGALGVILAVLKALGIGKTPASSQAKPKPKPKPAAKPKPKPKPSASAAKPKPKPKPSSHAASSKPKPASSSTKPKPKPKPKPKRSGEVSGESEPGEL